MDRKIDETAYKQMDKERITSALDNGKQYEAEILQKYSSLSRDEFEAILKQHPTYHQITDSYEAWWKQALQFIASKVSRSSYDTWFKHTKGIIQEDVLTIYCANAFQCDWLENQYKQLILDAVKSQTGKEYNINFQSETNKPFF